MGTNGGKEGASCGFRPGSTAVEHGALRLLGRASATWRSDGRKVFSN